MPSSVALTLSYLSLAITVAYTAVTFGLLMHFLRPLNDPRYDAHARALCLQLVGRLLVLLAFEASVNTFFVMLGSRGPALEVGTWSTYFELPASGIWLSVGLFFAGMYLKDLAERALEVHMAIESNRPRVRRIA